MATSTPGGKPTNLGMEPNVAALLCYVPCCVGLVFSIVAAVVEKQSRLVRFHAFQSLLLQGAAIVVLIGLSLGLFGLAMVGLGAVAALLQIVQWLVIIALFAAMVILMIKANGGEEFEIPVIGPMARQWV